VSLGTHHQLRERSFCSRAENYLDETRRRSNRFILLVARYRNKISSVQPDCFFSLSLLSFMRVRPQGRKTKVHLHAKSTGALPFGPAVASRLACLVLGYAEQR